MFVLLPVLQMMDELTYEDRFFKKNTKYSRSFTDASQSLLIPIFLPLEK